LDSNNPVSVFVVLVTLYIFSLTLSILSLGEWSAIFVIMAFSGLIVGLVVSLTVGLALQREGTSIAIAYLVFAGINQVTLVWFTTRFGHHLGFL